MRILLLLFFIATLVTNLKAKNCKSHSECRPDECCMTRSYLFGGCRSMGQIGSSCYTETIKSHMGDMFMKQCPCAEGLQCVPEKSNNAETSFFKQNGTCRSVTDQEED
uniref:U79-Liphistoxin-Lsp1a_1 n=1 Tax=Liphistius sp. SGP-2016 TaxID=1905180 RepID=A0A4Q8K273_9ARAC